VDGHRLVAHGGGIPGFSTEFLRFRDDKLTVIVLTNAEGGHAGALARGIAGRLVPALARKPDEPIADADARTTERLKGAIHGVMRGEVDPELFTEESRKALVSHLEEAKDQATQLGALKAFQLLERKANDRGVRLRYRAVFEKETVNAIFDLDKAGKIAGMGIRSED
jgi:D-alanyl-D-alanine carboxypeptidase